MTVAHAISSFELVSIWHVQAASAVTRILSESEHEDALRSWSPARPWMASRNYQETAQLRLSIGSSQDAINELRMIVSEEDPAYTFFGPPLELLSHLATVSAPPVAPVPRPFNDLGRLTAS